jgi:hypothetical protein
MDKQGNSVNSSFAQKSNIVKPKNLTFKEIKKLDFREIEKNKNELDTQKTTTITNKNNKSNEIINNYNNNFIFNNNNNTNNNIKINEKNIANDLEKFIELISNEDDYCDKLTNFQIPYLFLGINSKQSLNNNQKEIKNNKIKNNEEFFGKFEKKFNNDFNNNNVKIINNNTLLFSNSIATSPMLNSNKLNLNSNFYKKNKFYKK